MKQRFLKSQSKLPKVDFYDLLHENPLLNENKTTNIVHQQNPEYS
jgi:hypothetical protein